MLGYNKDFCEDDKILEICQIYGTNWKSFLREDYTFA